ncbi:MAG: cell division protein ZapA [Candidatus Marinimicrobia bacterium]|nr:cell division protein ZapA [Candidatus Neomarinimicrobiota bacterium]MCH8011102.1 cell division protein ZapA [Candidatus Neomarinimicrobiota bacterium]
MEENSDNLVRVSIFGQDYTVKAKADTNYIADVAQYVDKKMREVEEGLPSVQSGMRIAILAAMSITDDLFSVKQEKENVVTQVEDKAVSLIELIDEAIVS